MLILVFFVFFHGLPRKTTGNYIRITHKVAPATAARVATCPELQDCAMHPGAMGCEKNDTQALTSGRKREHR
jgi:hypothetical protein